MREYTEKIHAARLLKILERKNPCGLCPATPDYFGCCLVCARFVGSLTGNCPCPMYGIKEAIKRTWLSLEAKGYLE